MRREARDDIDLLLIVLQWLTRHLNISLFSLIYSLAPLLVEFDRDPMWAIHILHLFSALLRSLHYFFRCIAHRLLCCPRELQHGFCNCKAARSRHKRDETKENSECFFLLLHPRSSPSKQNARRNDDDAQPFISAE